MLQIKDIKKEYLTGELKQTALNGVSLNFRDNEFVAVLGPSGSGKTTLLNIIGGLDRYDSGDLIINGISTKKYKDKDWDSYRNHTIGFVFQSYNLIPHQSILSNVELALTISGISKSERKRRAKDALAKVGLGDQLHKRPNQMSGGQMQRVAIARALVNDPDILLADEPTGALDSETSIQVMELLNQVADDRLVVMVTHNPELAEQYATRIVKLRDGSITDDTAPFEPETDNNKTPVHKNMGKSSMSRLTSLALSFNNLRTKKGRTLLTSFAGSIGIIGIALILALSTGVNNYINDIQKETMTSYPITIDSQTFDLTEMIKAGQSHREEREAKSAHKLDGVYPNGTNLEMAASFQTNITENNLTKFKEYLDDPKSEIHDYIGSNGIVYSYDTKFDIYTYDKNNILVNTDGSTLEDKADNSNPYNMSIGQMSSNKSMDMSSMMSGGKTSNFEQLMPGTDGESIGKAVTDNYDVVYGKLPQKYNEVVLIMDHNNEVSATALYQLGILPTDEYKELMKKVDNGEKIKIKSEKLDYADICSKDYYLIPACDYFEKSENGTYTNISEDNTKVEELMKKAVKLKITAIIKPNEDNDSILITAPIGYTQKLTNYLIDYTNKSDIVKEQMNNKATNVLNGLSFAANTDKDKIADTKKYISSLGITDKANMMKEMLKAMPAQASAQMPELDETMLAAQLDNFLKAPDDKIMLNIYNTYVSAGTYDDNLAEMGVVSIDAPSSIDIYADSFEDKDNISDCIENYNKGVKEADKITYTDYVGLLMSSVTTIINVISYVLIAFVAVSLIVSSIMIGIITYISVLERTKEIGILRAIGASKRNISQVFNAETFIIGLISGVIGIGITLLLLLPGNAIIHSLTNTDTVNASLPIGSAIVLIVLSVILTLIGGFIPSKKAAKKDPVTALRTE